MCPNLSRVPLPRPCSAMALLISRLSPRCLAITCHTFDRSLSHRLIQRGKYLQLNDQPTQVLPTSLSPLVNGLRRRIGRCNWKFDHQLHLDHLLPDKMKRHTSVDRRRSEFDEYVRDTEVWSRFQQHKLKGATGNRHASLRTIRRFPAVAKLSQVLG